MQEQEKHNTIHKAADILRCITEGMNQSSIIADSLGLSRSTTHRLLKTLHAAGFVFQDPHSLHYDVGPLIYRLADYCTRSHQILLFCALGEMEKLRRTTDETVALVIRVGLNRMHLEELPSLHPLKYAAGKGSTAPIYAGSTGKLLLTQIPYQEMLQILDNLRLAKVGPNTITNRHGLLKELEKVRRQGYSISYAEIVPGSASVAVPIRNYSQPLAMCVLGPENRMSNRIDEILKKAKRAASAIERRLKKLNQQKTDVDLKEFSKIRAVS